MDNGEIIVISSDDEATLAAEATAKKHARNKKLARKAAAREAAARKAAAAREAARIVEIQGPNKNKGHAQIFDQFYVFPSRVALNNSQVNYLKKVARKRPTIPVYVCTVQDAMFDGTKGKMYFSRNYSLANIKRHLKLPAAVLVFTRQKSCATVRLIMSKGKGKGAQITKDWNKVVKATNMHIGDIVMFWFRRSSNGLNLIVENVM